MKYLRIAECLFNRPLMITEDKLGVIQHVFSRQSGFELQGAITVPMVEARDVDDDERMFVGAGYTVKDGLAVIGIYGPLMHRRLAGDFPSGGPTTYGEIRKSFDLAMEDDAVHGVVFDIDSPGGEVSGVFDFAEHVYQSRSKKPITAVVNESAYSAAYLIACAAGTIILPRTGGVGSVGVIATHADFSRRNEQNGITVTHVFAGDRKADYSPHHPLSEEAMVLLQGSVNENYQLFVETVAKYRGMDVQAVINTQAGTFEGQKAVAIGFADKVSAVDAAISGANKRVGSRLITATAESGANKKESTVMTREELQEKHPELVAQIEADARKGMVSQEDATTATSEAVTAEQGRCMGIAKALLGEDAGTKLAAVVETDLTVEQVGKLGITIGAESTDTTQQQMLDAITSAGAKGLQPAKVSQSEDEERKALSSRLAELGSKKK